MIKEDQRERDGSVRCSRTIKSVDAGPRIRGARHLQFTASTTDSDFCTLPQHLHRARMAVEAELRESVDPVSRRGLFGPRKCGRAVLNFQP